MKPSLLLATLSAAAALLPLSASAGFVSTSGTTSPGRIFNRPTETGTLSLYEAVPYDPYVFSVSQTGAYTLSLTADNPSFYDTFLHVYQGGFNPAAASDNFLLANDDSGVNGTTNSGLFNIQLTAGTQYVFVADGFSNNDYGSYVASVSGPGNITIAPYVVPEPATTALLGAALLGGAVLAGVRRRLAARLA